MADGVDALIFSKDRGCQLDLLLRSIDRHAPNVYSSLTVLWTASSAEYGRGYAVAFAEHARAKFIAESDFEGQVRHWLQLAGHAVSFLVDDDVFYRDVNPALIRPEIAPISLRGGDYDYPFSLDGNIYSQGQAFVALYGIHFRNPTELEANAHAAREQFNWRTVTPYPGEPCLVGVPLNRVSSASGMPSMGVHEFDLNEAYLGGMRLELADDFYGENLGTHAEIEMYWRWPAHA